MLKSIEIDAYDQCQNKIIDILKKSKCANLLDIGCNDGTYTKKIGKSTKISELYGIEIDDKLLKLANKNGINAIKGNINEKFPFKDNFFDVVISNQVIEHLTNPDNMIKEIHRILKPGGFAIISTPNLCSLHNRLFVLLGWQITNIAPSNKLIFGRPGRGEKSNMDGFSRHITIFSPPALKEMCNHYKLQPRNIYGSGFHPFKGIISNVLSKLLPKMSVFIIIQCKKSIN
jgi:SAM-dependent methyltransferase